MIFRGSLTAVFILLTLIRLYYARQAGGTGGTGGSGESPLRAALLRWLNLLAAAATLLYLIAPQLMRWSALRMPVWPRWVGVVMGLMTITLFLWVHHALGRNWSTSVQAKEQHTLVISGPYRWVRHPMYTTIFIWALAFFLLSANWFVGVTWLALSIVATSRVNVEEAALIEKFGAEYRTYRQHTGRFLPWLANPPRGSEPPEG